MSSEPKVKFNTEGKQEEPEEYLIFESQEDMDTCLKIRTEMYKLQTEQLKIANSINRIHERIEQRREDREPFDKLYDLMMKEKEKFKIVSENLNSCFVALDSFSNKKK